MASKRKPTKSNTVTGDGTGEALPPAVDNSEKTAPALEPQLRIRVLKSGTEFDGLRACKGLVTTTSQSNAEALEKQGLVKIIGV